MTVRSLYIKGRYHDICSSRSTLTSSRHWWISAMKKFSVGIRSTKRRLLSHKKNLKRLRKSQKIQKQHWPSQKYSRQDIWKSVDWYTASPAGDCRQNIYRLIFRAYHAIINTQKEHPPTRWKPSVKGYCPIGRCLSCWPTG